MHMCLMYLHVTCIVELFDCAFIESPRCGCMYVSCVWHASCHIPYTLSSGHCMPPVCRSLMSDHTSPIIDFYPTDFPLDLNGKRYAWQAVALLPWIDETRLLNELNKVTSQFTNEEKKRNEFGNEYIFLKSTHPLAQTLIKMYASLDRNHKDMTEVR